MKKLLLAALIAMGLALIDDAKASAWDSPGIGAKNCHRVGRIRGYWMNPTTGPLYDYSPYFAAKYPQIPNAAEYQWHPEMHGQPMPYGYGAAPAFGR